MSAVWNLFFVVITSTLIISKYSTESRRSTGKSPPKIWPREYIKDDGFEGVSAPDSFLSAHQFENEFISKTGSDFLLSQEVDTLVFACEAKYPVMWAFPFPDQLLGIWDFDINSNAFRQSLVDSGMEQPVNIMFRSYLHLRVTSMDFLSLNLTCQSVDSKVSASVHIFATLRHEIENQGQTINITVPTTGSLNRVVLPCRPADPKAEVILDAGEVVSSLDTPNKLTWIRQFPLPRASENLRFDPKVGFIFSNLNLGLRRQLSSTYRCTLEGTEDQLDGTISVYFNLIFTDDSVDHAKFQLISEVEQPASVNVSREYSEFIVQCCSNDELKPPIMISGQCGNPPMCELQKNIIILKPKFEKSNEQVRYTPGIILRTSGCPETYILNTHASSLVTCEGDDIAFAEQYLKLFKPENKTTSSSHKEEWINVFDAEIISKAWDAAVTRKTQIGIGKQYTGGFQERGYKLLLFKGGDFDSLISNDLRLIELIYARLDVPVYDGEIMRLMCFSLKYFYAKGAHIRLNWKNGTRTILEIETGDINTYVEYNDIESNDLFLATSKLITAQIEMESVDCFLPAWNSTKWDKISYNLSILASVQPKFFGDEEQTVYFSLHDSNHEISCEMSEGTPHPSLVITKDGKKIHENSLVNICYLNETTVFGQLLKFHPISYEMHGIYRCIAENTKGKVVKIFRVVIGEKPSLITPVMLSIVGSLAIILFGVAAYFGIQRLEKRVI